MPEIGAYDDLIRIKCDKKFKADLTAIAKRRGENLSDFCRRTLEAAMQEDNAKEGIDAITSIIRKVVKEQNKSFEDRFAAMIYKSTIPSATAMNLLLLYLENQGEDVLAMYEESNVKAVAYANTPLRDMKK